MDSIVLATGTIAACVVAQAELWLGLVIAFVVLHFFLFCNVFRMPPKLELLWASLFLMLGTGTLTMQLPGWPVAFGVSLLCAVVIVVFQMRQPSYHGVGWKRLNPGLHQWWQSQRASES